MKTNDASTSSSTSAPNSVTLEEAERLLAEAIEAQQLATTKREAAEAAFVGLGMPLPLFDRVDERKD